MYIDFVCVCGENWCCGERSDCYVHRLLWFVVVVDILDSNNVLIMVEVVMMTIAVVVVI